MIQQLLLAGQVIVLALVYLFVWRVMRTARGDLSAPTSLASQESTIIPAADVAAARRAAGLRDARIVVSVSDALRVGVPYSVTGAGLTLGRAPDNDITMEDDFVSTHHAQLVPPNTLIDLDSTNGTLVNGRALRGRVQLNSGDQFQIGSSVFRFEVPK